MKLHVKRLENFFHTFPESVRTLNKATVFYFSTKAVSYSLKRIYLENTWNSCDDLTLHKLEHMELLIPRVEKPQYTFWIHIEFLEQGLELKLLRGPNEDL